MKRLKIQAYCQVLKTLNNNIGVNGIMMQLDNAIEWDTSKRNKLELRPIFQIALCFLHNINI